MSKRRFDRRPYVTIGCEREERRKKKVRLDDNDDDDDDDDEEEEEEEEEEEVPVKRRDRRHNHKIGVYSHAHAHRMRLTDDQLKLTKEFSRCQVTHRNIMASLLKNDQDCAVSKQTIYNAWAKMKKKRM
ncbi:hypothetical protein M9H77_05130 [Catharanthus roseus]|uniref:Uncharacterized protein n=1 Tax=Catharanthus roseus TaxID=4058 RepID=A0ACC0CG08_CATRO|nr:hypothetical protein M9H77_05130 [Catharanthus roseus]